MTRWADSHIRAHFLKEVMPTETDATTGRASATSASLKTSGLADSRPWKLKALIALGLAMWCAYEFGECVLRVVR